MTRSTSDSVQLSSIKKRIVFVLPALTAGGAERVLITLMNGLDPKTFERFFVTVSEAGPLRSLIDPMIPFFSLSSHGRVSQNLFKLYVELRKIRPDIVVSTMTHMNFGVLLLKPFFPGTKFIVREAITPSYFQQKNFAERTITHLGWQILYRLAALVVSPAQKILDEFHDLGIHFKNHVVLPNPVDAELIRSFDNGGQKNGVQFVCAGRLDPQKGFDRLIEALPRMPANINWHLTIVGEGAQRTELETLIARHGLQNRVELAGYIAHPWPKIAAADRFLMPSRHEGLPNAVLEALACGTPVIATAESGGISEIASKSQTGSVSIVNDMDAFITAMAQVKPRPDTAIRPSLLPSEYQRKSVIDRFTRMLMQVSP